MWTFVLVSDICLPVCVYGSLYTVFSGCVFLTLSVWSVYSLMEVARAKCRAPSCCPRHPRWHALCPSLCPTLKPSARPLTADSAHPHLRVSHPPTPTPLYKPILMPSRPKNFTKASSSSYWQLICSVKIYYLLALKRCNHHWSSTVSCSVLPDSVCLP